MPEIAHPCTLPTWEADAHPFPIDRNPQPLLNPLVTRAQVEEHRAIVCGSYDRCLDHVVKKGWRGWTCRICPQFAIEKRSELERLRELAEKGTSWVDKIPGGIQAAISLVMTAPPAEMTAPPAEAAEPAVTPALVSDPIPTLPSSDDAANEAAIPSSLPVLHLEEQAAAAAS